MITDNTFDLMEAHCLLESDFNVSGVPYFYKHVDLIWKNHKLLV